MNNNLNGNDEETNQSNSVNNFAENKLISFLIDTVTRFESNFDSFKMHIENKFDSFDEKIDSIKEKIVTKEDCISNQEVCSQKFKQKKFEFSVTKIIAVLGLITGFTITLIKIFK